MASTLADNNRVAWTYTSDKGVDYRVSAKAVYVLGTEAAKYGGSAAAPTVPRLPKGFRMRKAYGTAGGKLLAITCYEPTATFWTGDATTVLRDVNGVDTTVTSNGGTLSEHAPSAGITQSA